LIGPPHQTFLDSFFSLLKNYFSVSSFFIIKNDSVWWIFLRQSTRKWTQKKFCTSLPQNLEFCNVLPQTLLSLFSCGHTLLATFFIVKNHSRINNFWEEKKKESRNVWWSGPTDHSAAFLSVVTIYNSQMYMTCTMTFTDWLQIQIPIMLNQIWLQSKFISQSILI
jgi:hypothetical protein